MNIIKKGTPKEERKYKIECFFCESIIEFKRKEAKEEMGRNTTILSITCPVCEQRISTEI